MPPDSMRKRTISAGKEKLFWTGWFSEGGVRVEAGGAGREVITSDWRKGWVCLFDSDRSAGHTDVDCVAAGDDSISSSITI